MKLNLEVKVRPKRVFPVERFRDEVKDMNFINMLSI